MAGVGVAPGERDGAHILCLIDGVNECGLACTQSYFAEFSDYADAKQIREAEKVPVQAEYMTTWILANCRNVEEAIVKIQSVACVNTPCPLTGQPLPQHFFLRDKYGRCAVFEPSVKCGFRIFDNPIGVMTNSPEFDWHMTNLSYYQHLSPEIIPGGVYDGFRMPTRKATGQMGLPGDSSSPSRFIWASYFVQHMQAPEHDNEAIAAGLQIASAMSVPKGAVGTGSDEAFYTQYSVVTDVEAGTLYLRFYSDTALRSLSLHAFDLNTLTFYCKDARIVTEPAKPYAENCSKEQLCRA